MRVNPFSFAAPPLNNQRKLVVAILLAFSASAASAADEQWDPEKTWTLENNHSHSGYLASNNQTGSTSSAPSGDASGYLFIVNAPRVSGNVAGAYSSNGNVSENQLEVSSNSTIELGSGMAMSVNIVGARTQKGTAENNKLIFSGSVEVQATMAGGYSMDGSANGNTLEFKGTATDNNPSIYGGYAFSTGNDEANADGNTLIVSGKITGIASSIGGGHTRSAGHANSNIVELMASAEVHGDIAGGYSYEGNVESNQVTIFEGADFYGDTIYGGRTQYNSPRSQANAENNTVTFSGEALGTNLKIYGGFADRGNASGNIVTIDSKASIKTTGEGGVNEYYGAYSEDGSTQGNSVKMFATDENAIVYGAKSENGAQTIYANNNTVTLAGQAKVSEVYGGHSGYTATGNTVVIQDQATAHTVYGGYALSAQALENTVDLRDNATVIGMVYASKNGYSSLETSGTVKVTGNVTAGNLAGFDKLELNLSESNNTESGKALLTLTGKSTDNANSNELVLDGVDVTINPASGLNPAGTYTLIALGGTDQSISVDTDTTFTVTGTFLEQQWDINTAASGEVTELTDDLLLDNGSLMSGDTMVAGVENKTVTANTNSKTLSESLLGSVAFINQGAEFIADEGLAVMTESAKLGELTAFGAIHGGSSNYKTGSRVDIDGYTLAAGASLKVTPDWIVGGFIEAGWAESDSHVEGTKGEGDHDYYGVGLATRYMVNDAWYVDGSFRVGTASTEFKGLYAGDSAKYDSDVFYVTAHAGTGYVFNLTDTVKLDVYGRYLVTYLDGDEVNLHNKFGDCLDLNSTTTHAVRVGGRMTGVFCPYAGWKLGLAYEHVFNGDAESAVNGFNLEVPSLEGDTAIIEMGVTMKPGQNSPWSMDVGAKGYAGDREGLTGSVLVRYAF